MEKKLFAELVASIKEMKEVQKGKRKPGRRYVVEPARTRVPAIRRSLGLSQSEFATMIGISVKTLQHWEQGRRLPDGPAQALLIVAAKNPRAVLKALHPKSIAG
jgi:putative transcriptional regulator